MFWFKFDQNRTKNEEFDFSKVKEEGSKKWTSISKFYSQLLLVNILICSYSNLFEIGPLIIITFLKRGEGRQGGDSQF